MTGHSRPPTGLARLNNAALNHGTAFTQAERRSLGLEGLLPPAVETPANQRKRVEQHLACKPDDLERYVYLQNLLDLNETLFWSLVCADPARYVPILYAPTLAAVCRRFSHIFRHPRGMYISLDMKGRIADILRNWPSRDVRFICVTTGGRTLSLGDTGVNGMGISIGKLQLYTICGGIPPGITLPVQLDIGTSTAALREDPLYLGLRRSPPPAEELDAFVAEFMEAVAEIWPGCCVHFEDWKGTDALRVLERYRKKTLCYNDDIQGTAAVTLAGLISALRVRGETFSGQRVLFFGAGASAIGITDLLTDILHEEGLGVAEARDRIAMMDIGGLVVTEREDLTEEQRVYARPCPRERDLLSVVRQFRPTILVGVSTAGGSFTPEIIAEMAKISDRPVIFPLSIPEAECTAEQAWRHSDNRALYAAGISFPEYDTRQGTRLVPGQANNFYIFPGLALAVYATRLARITPGLILESARALADQVEAGDLERGLLYPPQDRIREVAIALASRLAGFIFDNRLSSLPRPSDIPGWIRTFLYRTEYREDAV